MAGARAGEDALVPLARVVGAHGLRGELRVKRYNPESSLLLELPALYVRRGGVSDSQPVRRRVLGGRPHKDLVLLTLEGCEDRDAALLLRGSELLVPRSELPALAPGEHYLVDLVGLRAELESGQLVGTVEDVIAYPASDVLCIRTEQGLLELPMIEPYFVSASPEQGRIVVAELQDLEQSAGGGQQDERSS